MLKKKKSKQKKMHYNGSKKKFRINAKHMLKRKDLQIESYIHVLLQH